MAAAALMLAAGNVRAEHLTLYYAENWGGGSPHWTYWGIAPDGVTKLDIDQYDEIADDGGRYWGWRQITLPNGDPTGHGALYTMDREHHAWYIRNGQFSEKWTDY